MRKNQIFISFLLLSLGAAFFFDKVFMIWIMAHNATWKTLNEVLRWISHFGEGQYYLVPAFAILAFTYVKKKYWKHRPSLKRFYQGVCFYLGTYVSSAVAVHLLKIICGRPRPSSAHLNAPQDWHFFTVDGHWHSLPSGHAQATFVFALVMGRLFPRYRALLFGWSLCVGASRILLTKHFLGDVLAGYGVAFVFYLLMRHIFMPEFFKQIDRQKHS